MLGNRNSTKCNTYTRPFPFPQRGLHPSTLKEYMPCRYPNCSKCAVSPEAFSIHVDCFKLFLGSCTSASRLRFLFTVAAWKNPWPRIPPIDWNTTKAEIYSTGLVYAIEKYRIPQLKNIPVEILYIIRQLSADALLWRYISVLDLAEQLSAAQIEGLVELPLSRIAFWERGSKPFLKASDPLPGICRLSIDLKGVKRVERLSGYPRVVDIASNCFAFIIEEDENLHGVIAQFKV